MTLARLKPNFVCQLPRLPTPFISLHQPPSPHDKLWFRVVPLQATLHQYRILTTIGRMCVCVCVCNVLDKNGPGRALLLITLVSKQQVRYFCYLIRNFTECTCLVWDFGRIIPVVTFWFYYFATTFYYHNFSTGISIVVYFITINK